jgi:hypothetical protein
MKREETRSPHHPSGLEIDPLCESCAKDSRLPPSSHLSLPETGYAPWRLRLAPLARYLLGHDDRPPGCPSVWSPLSPGIRGRDSRPPAPTCRAAARDTDAIASPPQTGALGAAVDALAGLAPSGLHRPVCHGRPVAPPRLRRLFALESGPRRHGRLPAAPDTRALIRQMSQANPHHALRPTCIGRRARSGVPS